MKKLASSKALPRKLTLRAETIGILRQLALHELGNGRIAGGSGNECNGSPNSDFSIFNETMCNC